MQQHALILIVLLFSHVLLYSILYLGFCLAAVSLPHYPYLPHAPSLKFRGRPRSLLVTCTLTGMLWAPGGEIPALRLLIISANMVSFRLHRSQGSF